MKMNLFSPVYLLTALCAAGFVAIAYFLFRNRTETTKRNILILLMALNILQHFFKHYIYPHTLATGLHVDNTAYNICAFLILVSPLFHFGKSESARQFIAYVGTAAGAVAILVPFWFFGRELVTFNVISEYIRFFICHELLLATSILPALWGRVRFNHLDGWKFGLYFIGMLCVILVNNVIFTLMTNKNAVTDLYHALGNPAGIMGPPANNSPFNALIQFVEALSPPVFLGGGDKIYVPILWYAIPLYYGITLVAIPCGILCDRKNFIADFRAVFLHKGTAPVRKKLSPKKN